MKTFLSKRSTFYTAVFILFSIGMGYIAYGAPLLPLGIISLIFVWGFLTMEVKPKRKRKRKSKQVDTSQNHQIYHPSLEARLEQRRHQSNLLVSQTTARFWIGMYH